MLRASLSIQQEQTDDELLKHYLSYFLKEEKRALPAVDRGLCRQSRVLFRHATICVVIVYQHEKQLNDNTMTTTTPNARHAIELLLTTETCRGKYLTGSEITSCPVPSVEILLRDNDGNISGRKKLSFPLDASGVAAMKKTAERAGIGMLDQTVVNLDIRKT